MSRSNPEADRLINPAGKFFEFNGAEGVFEYYDKELDNPVTKKKGMKVKLPLPFTFIVLDTLASISGYSDNRKNGFYSNEVRNIKTEKLFVRCGKDKVAEGTYDQIKNKEKGMNYTSSVYIASNEGGVLKINHVKMSGAALSAWIEFRNKATDKVIGENGVTIKSCTDEVKGAVKYKKPIFQLIQLKPEINAKAIELDVELQEYLKKYFLVGSPLSKTTPEEEAEIVKESPELIAQTKAAVEALSEEQAADPLDMLMADDQGDLPF